MKQSRRLQTLGKQWRTIATVEFSLFLRRWRAAGAVGIKARGSPISRNQAACNAFGLGGKRPRELATKGELGAGRMIEVDIFFHHEGVFTGVAQRRVIAAPHADL